MKHAILICVAVAVLLGAGEAAYGHHSFTAAYDNTKRVEVEGVVETWNLPGDQGPSRVQHQAAR